MGIHVRGGMLLAVLSAISVMTSTTDVSAQFFSRGCQRCLQPVNHCNCQSHQPVVHSHQSVIQSHQPVVETQMVPQQVMTYRNEVVTQYRQEQITQNVPVTTYRDVVVDEGSYQTVYVPKQVTKRIPQVTYQQQIGYRSVPFQVTRQVPQVVTQMVPQQIVRTPAVSYQTAVAPISTPVYPVAPMAAAPCGPCGGVAYAPAPIYQTVPTLSFQSVPIMSQSALGRPVIASNPVTMLPVNPQSADTQVADTSRYSVPVPDPKFLDSPGATRESWATVGSRNDGRSGGSGAGDSRTSSTSGIRFKPARMVYQSWESQSRIAAGEGPERR